MRAGSDIALAAAGASRTATLAATALTAATRAAAALASSALATTTLATAKPATAHPAPPPSPTLAATTIAATAVASAVAATAVAAAAIATTTFPTTTITPTSMPTASKPAALSTSSLAAKPAAAPTYAPTHVRWVRSGRQRHQRHRPSWIRQRPRAATARAASSPLRRGGQGARRLCGERRALGLPRQGPQHVPERAAATLHCDGTLLRGRFGWARRQRPGVALRAQPHSERRSARLPADRLELVQCIRAAAVAGGPN